MPKSREGILGQIIRIDNSLKIKSCNFVKSQDITESKFNMTKCMSTDIEDYKKLKEGINTVDISIHYRKLAFQPVRIHSRYKQ